jgi:hypothetical protein
MPVGSSSVPIQTSPVFTMKIPANPAVSGL